MTNGTVITAGIPGRRRGRAVGSVIARTLTLGALMVSLAGLTGCSKMLANFSLKQAGTRLDEAKTHEADKFAQDDLTKTQDLINKAQNEINTEQHGQARQTAKQAATAAKDLLERTKTQRANFLKTESNKWLGYMDKNDGRAVNPNLYESVLASIADGQAAHEKQNWDNAIESFFKSVEDAEFLLENLKNEAQHGLDDMEKLRAALSAEGAEEHYPESLIEIEDSRSRIENLIVDQYDYRTAITLHNQALQLAQAGIVKTKEIKSDKLLRQIESRLSTAVQIGAEIFAPRTLENMTRDFEDLLKQFYEQKFDTVLTSGPKLLPRAENLILETQRESAKDKLKSVDKAIAGLIEGKAKTYLPGRVEQMEQMGEQARVLFDEENYTETESVALGALEEEKKVIDEFDAFSQEEIANAWAKLTIAESVFTTMEDIFAKRAPGAVTGDDEALENIKLSLREELRAKIRNSRLELGIAQLRKDDKVFHQAVEVSRDVVAESNEIVQETFHVVAHNAVQEISNELTRYEREGGREYAGHELDKTIALLGDTRGLIKDTDYREAAERAAETKAQLEILAQELERVAKTKLDVARERLDVARKYRAGDFEEDTIQRVEALIDLAETNLGDEEIRQAISEAENAMDMADVAGSNALEQWVMEELRRTDTTLTRAEAAETERYAPAMLDDAVNLRRNAQSLYDAGNMIEAQAVASDAALTAQNALYAQIITAEDEIALAKQSEGWEYETERLASAIFHAKWAREFMDKGDYDRSQQNARQSITTARNVTQNARNAAFSTRLASLKEKITIAETKGPGYYQVADLSRLIGSVQVLQSEFEPERFENAREEISRLEVQLEGLMETTPSVLRDVLDNLTAKLNELEDRAAQTHYPDLVALANQKIRFAQIDFKNEKFRNSYMNVRDGVTILNEIELGLDERVYDRQLAKLFTGLSDTLRGFSPVLNMGTPVLMKMIEGPTGRNQALHILSASDPGEFRQEISDLLFQADQLKVPTSRGSVHTAALDVFEQTRKAALGFEQLLIIDQYSIQDARKIISSAYLRIRSARTLQRELQQQLDTTSGPAKTGGIRRAIEFR